MGCEFGKPKVVTTVQEELEVEVTGFSDTQIDTIRSTWPLLASESVKVGVEIFIRIFREAPSIQALFSHLSSVSSLDDLHQSHAFREHARHFMGVIQDLVDHLECPQAIDHQLLILGARHATFHGYHPEYFRFFTKCMMDEWETRLGEEFIHEVRDSWKLAFDFVVERMTEGFDMCLNGQIQDLLHAAMPPPTASTPSPLKRHGGGGGVGGGGGGFVQGQVLQGQDGRGGGMAVMGNGGGGGGGGGRSVCDSKWKEVLVTFPAAQLEDKEALTDRRVGIMPRVPGYPYPLPPHRPREVSQPARNQLLRQDMARQALKTPIQCLPSTTTQTPMTRSTSQTHPHSQNPNSVTFSDPLSPLAKHLLTL
ncbi:uncharacterized protein LOC143297680 [Babylonia areolata]|uniref:uncharacterized protein LOC143297680 n=1 Tax=Babylonia areolata TaxID=304850 RepID=UPI003FCF735A